MARTKTKEKGSLQGVEIDLGVQPGKQQKAMDLTPNFMVYGGAAGCVDSETEYLSKHGWRKIKDWQGEEVYQYNPHNKKLTLCQPYYVKEDNSKDGFYKIESASGVDQVLTMQHRFVFYKKKKSKKHFEMLVGDLLVTIQAGKPLSGYIETLSGERVPFNIKGKPETELKVYQIFPEDPHKYCFETKTGFLFLKRNNHQFVTGNSGKSRLLLLKALKYAYNDPKFFGVIFRRTSPPLRNGGLFDSAKNLYLPLKPSVREMEMRFLFNSTGGGQIKFDHLEKESTPIDNH